MKKTRALFFLLLLGAWMMGALNGQVSPTVSKAVFQVQNISVASSSPCKVTFAVRYYISPTYPKACFIGAFIPDKARASGDFGLVPAGRPGVGVPKGQHEIAEKITFDIRYAGIRPFSSSTIEVAIYDVDGATKGSAILTFRKDWARFEIQAIQVIEDRPDFVKFQLQYFVDPEYSPVIGIVPTFPKPPGAHPYDYNYTYMQADHIRKGQVNFGANVCIWMRYNWGPAFSMTAVELSIWGDRTSLYSRMLPLNHNWVAPTH
jgi:hypothetical protein